MAAVKALSKAELAEGLVERLPEYHKGVYGHALVVAGSRENAMQSASNRQLRLGILILDRRHHP